MKRLQSTIIVSLLAALACAAPLFAQEKPDALKTYRQGRDFEAQGRTADANERYEAAIGICKAEISQNPSNMDSYAVITWTLIRQRKYQEAVEWGLRGLKINSTDARVTESLGEAYFYIEDYKESIKYMQRYVDSAPQGERVSVAYFFMGEIYRIQRQPKHADIAYTLAVKLEPGLALWWYRLGTAREQASEYQSAAAAYEKAVALNPSYKEAAEALNRVKKQN